ncbi:MAG: hypothetical protein IBX46_00180 [Desulfuromonadales bacterium]|nr:hypothetical protein [Desulfuromonadales bacterium]
MRRSLLFLLLFFCLASCHTLAPPRLISTEITGNELWSGRIEIDGDVVIAENASVRIAPGSEIVFLPPSAGKDRLTDHPHFVGSELIVRGRLLAEGTAAAPITFRALDPAAPAGSWGAINLVQSAGSRFSHCRFTQADSALHSQEADVEVVCSTFSRNLVGVRFHSSRIKVSNNTFRGNGTAIRFHFGAPVIEGNLLMENDKGLFVTSFPRDYRISGNAILASREFQVVLGEEVPDDLLLPGNYWGSVDPMEIRSHFFDGQETDYLGLVDFEPFLSTPPPAPETLCKP